MYPDARMSETRYIENGQHYEKLITMMYAVTKTLWIGTADIKDLYVKKGSRVVPLLEILSDLIQRGVSVRLIHAKEPGPNFRKDFDHYPALFGGLERMLCPRVHFKLILFDNHTAYIGSANLTGAGLGMKGSDNRNFEAGILTTDPSLVEAAVNQFDRVWMGAHCNKCKRKDFCIDPIGK